MEACQKQRAGPALVMESVIQESDRTPTQKLFRKMGGPQEVSKQDLLGTKQFLED